MKLLIATTMVTTLAVTPLLAVDNEPAKRLDAAAAVFSEIMGTPDKGIPQHLLQNAHCIVIVPDLKTAAFGVGGKYGKGYLSCRNTGGRGLVCACHGPHRGRERGLRDRRFFDGLDHVGHEVNGERTSCLQANSR